MIEYHGESIYIFIRVIALDLVRIGDDHAKVSTTMSKILPHPQIPNQINGHTINCAGERLNILSLYKRCKFFAHEYLIWYFLYPQGRDMLFCRLIN